MKRAWLALAAATLQVAAKGCGAPAASRSPSHAASALTPGPAATPAEGEDFAADARLLYRIAACSGHEPLPPGLDPAILDAHCEWLQRKMSAYRSVYVREAEPFLAALRPHGMPTTVVYPFGGGDLLSALTTYPDATEITTISLEHGGDPRRLRSLDNAELARGLGRLRACMNQLLTLDDSASDALMRVERGGIPGQLAFFLVGLAVHGYEPVSLRYFRLQPDGSLHYLSKEEIAASDSRRAQRLNRVWTAPDFSEAFSNLELTFRAVAPEGAQAPLRIHRHIAANLSDPFLAPDGPLLRHLERKGRVAALVKAASYLLWSQPFGNIRNYLIANADFTISDTTGIPPRYAAGAGLVQETYGSFEGTFIPASRKESLAFQQLWRSQPKRALPFRFGYGDVHKHAHLLVTRRVAGAPAPVARYVSPPSPTPRVR